MTTLGYGDITFWTPIWAAASRCSCWPRASCCCSCCCPFMLIQFVYAPWLEARNAARTPRELPPDTHGHVILTSYGPVEAALIERLEQFHLPYVVIVDDTARALALHDQGVRVMVGPLDSVETYRRAQGRAARRWSRRRCPTRPNAHVMLTVREAIRHGADRRDGRVGSLDRTLQARGLPAGHPTGRTARPRNGAARCRPGGGRTHVIGRLDSSAHRRSAGRRHVACRRDGARFATARALQSERRGRLGTWHRTRPDRPTRASRRT